MNKEKFTDYFLNMFKELYLDTAIILILTAGYEVYREGKSVFVKRKYLPNKRPEKTIKKYVRARMLLDNLLVDYYPIESVDNLLSDIDWAIQQKFSTLGKVEKEFSRIAKKFLQEEYPFTDKEIVKIFSIYNEIIKHDTTLKATLPMSEEEDKLIEEYKHNIENRTSEYIQNLQNN